MVNPLRATLHRLTLIFCLGFAVNQTHSQWVSIPDSNFGKWLQNISFGQCVRNDSVLSWQLDTVCAGTQYQTRVVFHVDDTSVTDITGVKYFKGFTDLYVDKNNLKFLADLPNSIEDIVVLYSQLDSISSFPSSLVNLNFTGKNLTRIPAFPSALQTVFMRCPLLELGQIPLQTKSITLAETNVKVIPYLPNGFETLRLSRTNVDSFTLPFPASMKYFGYEFAVIDSLPNLPPNLTTLSVNGIDIPKLPELPNSLINLYCGASTLNELPTLPDSLAELDCRYSLDLRCLPSLKKVRRLRITGSSIQCLPNIPLSNQVCEPPLHLIPLCNNFNANGCNIGYNVSGIVFVDTLQNCVRDTSVFIKQSAKILLEKNGVIGGQFFTTKEGFYSLDTEVDSYTVRIDTTDLPVRVTCPSGYSHLLNITQLDSIKANINFGLACNSVAEIGVLSAVRDSGLLFPAQEAGIHVYVGDLGLLYGLSCATGVSGTVVIKYTGPAKFSGVGTGALIPFINGKELTYTIADFSLLEINKVIGLKFVTDTFAQIGQELCLQISITATTSDNTPNNNTATYCFPITNSYDPNMKEVSPTNSILPTEDWLTYTIHFQNMGNAPALHIYVLDTLDANLDETSIQITGSSHRMNAEVQGKIARFNFPNINLIDSATNEPESKGWLQYKVKKKANLPLGTQIKNTASIYFDFNAPVVTNTVTNTVEFPSGVKEVHQNINLSVYPNPTNDLLYINYTAPTQAEVTLHSINGVLCSQNTLNQSGDAISLINLPAGVYFVTVTAAGNTERRKVVKW